MESKKKGRDLELGSSRSWQLAPNDEQSGTRTLHICVSTDVVDLAGENLSRIGD